MRKLIHIFSLTLIIFAFSVGCSNKDESVLNDDDTQENQEATDEGNRDASTEDKSVTSEDELIKQLIDIKNDSSITVLVNKFNNLSESYIPDDLVTVSVPTILENPEVNQLREEASQALSDMFAAAEQEDLFLFARSGYRSYNTQIHLFNSYAERHGEEAANQYSARPGYSEHQTGLVMDVTSESVQFELTEHFGETPEGKWIVDHAYKYGFIIRYPKGKDDITGYIYEPWHLRYLGKEVAESVHHSNLTYEEFLLDREIINDLQFEKE